MYTAYTKMLGRRTGDGDVHKIRIAEGLLDRILETNAESYSFRRSWQNPSQQPPDDSDEEWTVPSAVVYSHSCTVPALPKPESTERVRLQQGNGR